MLSQRDLIKVLVSWLPLAFVGTMVVGAVYVAVQQDMRQGANDPQIQMAEDAASQLKAGSSVALVTSSMKVDPQTSLAPFLIIYDSKGNVVSSQASIDGRTPELPSGVLDNTKTNGESRITWEIADGTRMATVVSYYDGPNSGYVLAGRSLREVEIRENKLSLQMGLMWVTGMLGSLVLVGMMVWCKGWLRARETV